MKMTLLYAGPVTGKNKYFHIPANDKGVLYEPWRVGIVLNKRGFLIVGPYPKAKP